MYAEVVYFETKLRSDGIYFMQLYFNIGHTGNHEINIVVCTYCRNRNISGLMAEYSIVSITLLSFLYNIM